MQLSAKKGLTHWNGQIEGLCRWNPCLGGPWHTEHSESTAWPSARDVDHQGPGRLTLRATFFAFVTSRVRGTRRPWSCWLLSHNDWAWWACLLAALLVLLLFLAVHHCHRRLFVLFAFAFAVLVVLLFLGIFLTESKPLGRRHLCARIRFCRLSAVFASLGKLASFTPWVSFCNKLPS